MGRKKSDHVELDNTNALGGDDLAVFLKESLNSKSKDGAKIAYLLDEEDDPSNITDWLSTGSDLLDLAVSNRKKGGLPVGRIVTLEGLESSGKSLLCAHLMVESQKRGGTVVYVDTERSTSREFWVALGVDLKRVVMVPTMSLEETFDYVEWVIGEARKKDANKLLTILVDSVAGTSTLKELESGYDLEGYATSKALILSKAMRKLTGTIAKSKALAVFTNQLRMNLNATAFGDKYVSPGGKALPYHSSVVIRLTKLNRIKNSDKEVVGVKVQAQVTKNRCGPPYKVAVFDVMFDSGINNLDSWLDYMKTKGIITGTRRGFTYKGSEDIKFTPDKFIELMQTNESLKEEMYNKMADNFIMKYRGEGDRPKEELQYDNDED